MTEPSSSDDERNLAALDAATVGIRDVNASLETLSARVTVLNERWKRSRRNIAWLATSLIADVVLTVVVSLLLAHQNTLADQQSNVTNGALCPLYALIVNSYRPQNRTPAELPTYNATFKVIQDGYKALNCTTPQPTTAPPTQPSSGG